MERTQKQIEASRANGARSRGPVTAAGKRISAQNARKHGAYSAIATPEWALDRFPELLAAYTAEYRPATTTQRTDVFFLAAAHARILQLRNMEKVVWDAEIRKFPNDCPLSAATKAFHCLTVSRRTLTVLGQHEANAERRYFNALSRLRHPKPFPKPSNREKSFSRNEPGQIVEKAMAAGAGAADFDTSCALNHNQSHPTPAIPPQQPSEKNRFPETNPAISNKTQAANVDRQLATGRHIRNTLATSHKPLAVKSQEVVHSSQTLEA